MEIIVSSIDSSSLSRVRWEDEDLTVTFQSGQAYRYEGVPLETVTEVLEAESIGSAFHSLIRSAPFPYEKVTA